MNVNDLNPDVVQFKDQRSKRLHRDRFVFPEVLVGTFIDNDEIIEKIEEELKNRIQEGVINNFSNETMLKNVFGPFYNDLSTEEKEIFLSIIEEIKIEKIKIKQEGLLGDSLNRRRALSDQDLETAKLGAAEFLKDEAGRAGFTSEVSRNVTTGELSLEGDVEKLEGRIIFDDDTVGELEK